MVSLVSNCIEFAQIYEFLQTDRNMGITERVLENYFRVYTTYGREGRRCRGIISQCFRGMRRSRESLKRTIQIIRAIKRSVSSGNRSTSRKSRRSRRRSMRRMRRGVGRRRGRWWILLQMIKILLCCSTGSHVNTGRIRSCFPTI